VSDEPKKLSPELLRLCTFVRVRSWSQIKYGVMQVDAESPGVREGVLTSIGQLDEQLAEAIGSLFHKRRPPIPVEDLMDTVDLWLQSGGGR